MIDRRRERSRRARHTSPAPASQALSSASSNLRRVNQQQAALILRLSEQGHSSRQVATMVGFTHGTVLNTLNTWHDVRDLARRIPAKNAVRMAEAAVEGAIAAAGVDRNPEHCIKILKDIEVLPKDAAGGADSRVQIVVAMPGMAVPALPGDHVGPVMKLGPIRDDEIAQILNENGSSSPHGT